MKTYPIPLGKCGSCGHCMIEEVDTPFFMRVDGKEMRIPEDCPPPAMLCTAGGGIRECRCSDDCPDYEEVEE
ncbi:hypothetical protein TALC_00359 [Thermoplasmatales archaeon BRNA1]|nr:hypothetical protein TALC_00359 [Thermoplasmatales archaeon BRNA1]